MQGGAPQVISWFIIPLTIDISPINHSYWSYVHQLSYQTGAPPCSKHGRFSAATPWGQVGPPNDMFVGLQLP